MKRKNNVIGAIGIAFLLLISANAKEAAFAAAGPLKAVPPDYHYNPAGKPDPFKPFIELDLAVKKKVEKKAALSIFPLQREGLDQFNLVGIGGNDENRIAIVEAKNKKGKFYHIALGTIIGLNGGKVVEIRKDRFIVEEGAKGRSGKKTRITKKFQRDEEEGTP